MVNVCARIVDQNGKPVVKARITMRLTTIERYCGLIVPRETSQYTDANGNAILRVWPNELGTEGSEYMVTISYGDACASPCARQGAPGPSMSQRFRVVVPNADCNLFDITDLPPYEQRGSGQVITAEVAAFASQAANAADRAQNAIDTAGAIRSGMEEIANLADSAKVAAQEAARLAQGSERRACELVDGFDSKVAHFQNGVVEQTEKTANKLVAAAISCISQTESTALNAIETRSGEVLNEISERGSQIQKAAVEAIISSRENALGEIYDAKKQSLEELREEAGLFGEDFEALTERAESAAKRSGCSAAAAANSATKACLCAEQAEAAADRIGLAKVEAMEAANQARTDHACAHADAVCAENAATEAHLDAGKAEAAAISAEKSAGMADCCAKKACKCADAALDIHQCIEQDKEYIDQAVPKVVAALEEKEDRLAELEKRQDAVDEGLDLLETKMDETGNRAEDAVLRAENILSVVRGENCEYSWLLPDGAKNEDIIELPIEYVVGNNMIRLSWGGMLLYQDLQYREFGEKGEPSNKIQLLCEIKENSTMNVWVASPHVAGDLLALNEKANGIIAKLDDAFYRTNIENKINALNKAVSGQTVTYVMADIAERDALANPKTGDQAWVKDATADSTVKSGAAKYIYESDEKGWVKSAEAESMDIVQNWADVQNKPASSVADIDKAVGATRSLAGHELTVDKKGDLQLDGNDVGRKFGAYVTVGPDDDGFEAAVEALNLPDGAYFSVVKRTVQEIGA